MSIRKTFLKPTAMSSYAHKESAMRAWGAERSARVLRCTYKSTRRLEKSAVNLTRAQHFSSQSEPPQENPFDLLSRMLRRARERSKDFNKYAEHDVFAPNYSLPHKWWLFAKMQLPMQTEIDGVEFIQGAQQACDLVMNSLYSPEFMNYATGAITESPAADTLKGCLSPACLDAFLFSMRETNRFGHTFILDKLDIHGCYISGVHWNRLTLANIKHTEAMSIARQKQLDTLGEAISSGESPADALSRASKQAEELKDEDLEVEGLEITQEDHDTIVERMMLDVRLESTEHLQVRMKEGEDQNVPRNSAATWRFESLVTEPEDMDWRIVTVF